MKLLRGFIICIGIIGVLVVAGLVVGYCLFSLTPSLRGEMKLVAVSADAAQSFDQKCEAFETEIEEAVASGEKREMSLTITDKEVNSKLIEVLAEGELPLKEILVNFGDDYFMVYAKVDNSCVDAKTVVMARLDVVEDDLEVTVEDFHLGKLLLPQSMNGRVGSILTILLPTKTPLADLPLDITSIEIKFGELTIKGVARTAG